MSKYLLIDTQNLFMRTYMSQFNMDSSTKIGLSLHSAFNGIKKAWDKFNPTHVVFCAEGRSWRKDFDEAYKRNRSVKRASQSPREKEEMESLFLMINEFISFIDTKTNCTLLQHPELEADDLIAGWIQTHPTDEHIIVSTDTDFHQLLSSNVSQYNATQGYLYSINGVFNDKDQPGTSIKAGKEIPIETPNPELALFIKCVKGDTSDNVYSAYPGSRMKSTKKQVGILDAFEDRINKGYNWNSFMNTKVISLRDGKEESVKTLYAQNVILVDLTAQPEIIKTTMFKYIEEKKNEEPKKMIGVHFLRFTETYNLKSIQNFPDGYLKFLSAKDE